MLNYLVDFLICYTIMGAFVWIVWFICMLGYIVSKFYLRPMLIHHWMRVAAKDYPHNDYLLTIFWPYGTIMVAYEVIQSVNKVLSK